MVWCHVTAVVMVCVKSRFANKVYIIAIIQMNVLLVVPILP